jgi:hypothetical protein
MRHLHDWQIMTTLSLGSVNILRKEDSYFSNFAIKKGAMKFEIEAVTVAIVDLGPVFRSNEFSNIL